MKSEAHIFRNFPEHSKIFAAAVKNLKKYADISGAFLAGSFARGNADRYSDIDITLFASLKGASLRSLAEEFAEDCGAVIFIHSVKESRNVSLSVIYEKDVKCDLNFYPVEFLSAAHIRPEAIILKDESRKIENILDKNREIYERESTLPSFLADAETGTKEALLWVRYIASKITRGELFSALHGLESFRTRVLFELACMQQEIPVRGIRHFEQMCESPELIKFLGQTVPKGLKTAELKNALEKSFTLFQQLRGTVYDSTCSDSLRSYEEYIIGTLKSLE